MAHRSAAPIRRRALSALQRCPFAAWLGAQVQLINGPLFAAEGIMMGVGAFGFLALLTSAGVGALVGWD